jgi:hypothetical protein
MLRYIFHTLSVAVIVELVEQKIFFKTYSLPNTVQVASILLKADGDHNEMRLRTGARPRNSGRRDEKNVFVATNCSNPVLIPSLSLE